MFPLEHYLGIAGSRSQTQHGNRWRWRQLVCLPGGPCRWTIWGHIRCPCIPEPAGIQSGCPVVGRPAPPSVDAPRRPRATVTCTSGRGGRSPDSSPCLHGGPSCAAWLMSPALVRVGYAPSATSCDIIIIIMYCVGCRKTSRVAAWLSRRVLLKQYYPGCEDYIRLSNHPTGSSRVRALITYHAVSALL